MVYPRTRAIWDNYGEVDPDNYMNQNGVYPRIIMAMLARLGEGCPAPVVDGGDGGGTGGEPATPCPRLDDT